MARQMLINSLTGQECRIVVLNDSVMEELYVERASSASRVGNIYKGRVTNIEPSIQAAFIDFGVNANADRRAIGRGAEDVDAEPMVAKTRILIERIGVFVTWVRSSHLLEHIGVAVVIQISKGNAMAFL